MTADNLFSTSPLSSISSSSNAPTDRPYSTNSLRNDGSTIYSGGLLSSDLKSGGVAVSAASGQLYSAKSLDNTFHAHDAVTKRKSGRDTKALRNAFPVHSPYIKIAFPTELRATDEMFENWIVNLVISEPVILPDVVPGNTIRNVSAIPGDGFKSEIGRLYKTLNAMKVARFKVKKDVIDNLFRWWMLFDRAVCDYFNMEELVIFAQIENHASLRGPMGARSRQAAKMEIFSLAQSVARCRDQFIHTVTIEGVKYLVGSIDRWVQKFLNYLCAKKIYVTESLDEVATVVPSIVSDVDIKTMKRVRRLEGGHLLQAIISNFVPKSEAKAWRQRHASGPRNAAFRKLSLRQYESFAGLLHVTA